MYCRHHGSEKPHFQSSHSQGLMLGKRFFDLFQGRSASEVPRSCSSLGSSWGDKTWDVRLKVKDSNYISLLYPVSQTSFISNLPVNFVPEVKNNVWDGSSADMESCTHLLTVMITMTNKMYLSSLTKINKKIWSVQVCSSWIHRLTRTAFTQDALSYRDSCHSGSRQEADSVFGLIVTSRQAGAS